jgi:hypothetical protein
VNRDTIWRSWSFRSGNQSVPQYGQFHCGNGSTNQQPRARSRAHRLLVHARISWSDGAQASLNFS